MTPYPLFRESNAQRAKIWVDHEKIREVFLHRLDNFMVICLRESFKGGFADNIAEVDVVFTILRFSQFIDEKLN
jgi:hypothetical protein